MSRMAFAGWLAMQAGALAAADLAVFAKPAVQGDCDGPWMVELAARGPVESRVLDWDGNPVAGPFAAKVFSVPKVKPWSAETPVCYRLETVREDGRREETVFGFVERQVRDGHYFVNGRPVRLKLGPKSVNGNAALALDCPPLDGWTNGVYRLSLVQLPRLAVERPAATEAATRHRFQDWSVTPTNYCGRLVVANRNSFRSAADVKLTWTLLVDGEAEENGTIDLYDLAPGSEAVFDMPPEVIAARFREATVSVRFAFVRAGETIAEDQVDLVASREAVPLSATMPKGFFAPAAPTCREMQEGAVVRRRFETRAARFTTADTGLDAYAYVRKGVLSDTPLVKGLRLWRARPPADSEIPLDIALPASPVGLTGGRLTFTDGFVASENLEATMRWSVYPDGTVACQARLRTAVPIPGERLGFVLMLDRAAPHAPWYWPWSTPACGSDVPVEWFGRGPEVNGPQRTEGAFLGRWRQTADRPLEAEEVRGLRVGDLTVRTLGAPFAVRLDGEGGTALRLSADPSEDGTVELAFTLSAGDSALTARTPDTDDGLQPFRIMDTTLEGNELK